jgi:phosphoglycerol transferase MdoB-like AlkP superfamily enzyme
VLHAAEETSVPVTVQNIGQDAWDTSQTHLSYHWLWLVPRELLKRSRTVPFQDGIRTVIAAGVPPGGTAQVEGRLLAPDYPGLYWLQWDMVKEGVTWFAQVSPRTPRQLVIVLPTLSGLFAPLPLLVALLASISLGRGRARSRTTLALLAGADVIWCAAVLLSKPLILIHEALLEPTPMAYWLTLVAAVTPPVVALVLLPRRARAWTLLAAGVLGTLLMLGDALYYRFFGDVLSVSAMLAARQAGQVTSSIRSLMTSATVWLIIDVPCACWLTIALSRRAASIESRRPSRSAGAFVLVLVAAGGILPTAQVLGRGRLDQMFRDRAVMEQLGPVGYHAYDAWSYVWAEFLRPPVSSAQIEEVQEWFADRAVQRAGTGPTFGAAAGKNLIVIQVESLQDFAVDYRINGQLVMPHLHRWSDDGLRLTNVTDQTSEGRTSDAEFTALTSLLPLDHGAAAFRYAGNHYVGFPRVLTEHGYSTLSAVAFEAGFWNRRVTHPSYGFQDSLFEPAFQLTEQIGWGLNDRDFLQQMIPRLERTRPPFAAWLITLSLHHPFDGFPEAHKVLQLGALEHTSFGNYLHTMRFFDTALDDFQSALGRAGLLDDTMLVVFGDHDAGFAHSDLLASTVGIDSDVASWELNDRVPFLIKWPRGTIARVTGRLPIAAGQTDFAPTLLALLGIDPVRLPYVGRNLLGHAADVPIVRPYGDWLDRTHVFISRSRAEHGDECYETIEASPVDPAQCSAANAQALKTRDVARLVVTEQLQQRLREALR